MQHRIKKGHRGNYLNPIAEKFKGSRNSKIYVDKSEFIKQMNELLNTEQKYVCISRPRRFGKSMVAGMLLAYDSCEWNADELFNDLKISRDVSYHTHKNKYDVLMINMKGFLSWNNSVEEMLTELQGSLIEEIRHHAI